MFHSYNSCFISNVSYVSCVVYIICLYMYMLYDHEWCRVPILGYPEKKSKWLPSLTCPNDHRCDHGFVRPLERSSRLARPQGHGLRLARPLGHGPCLAWPLGCGSGHFRPLRKGSTSFDPRGVGSVPLDPWRGFRLARPRDCRVNLWQGRRPPQGPSPPATATNARCGPRTMPLTLGRGQTRLDVTIGRHRLYLGTHVSNSIEWTSTMMLNPRATLDKGICWPYRMLGRDEAPSGGSCL
jgi:hypothetical protein